MGKERNGKLNKQTKGRIKKLISALQESSITHRTTHKEPYEKIIGTSISISLYIFPFFSYKPDTHPMGYHVLIIDKSVTESNVISLSSFLFTPKGLYKQVTKSTTVKL